MKKKAGRDRREENSEVYVFNVWCREAEKWEKWQELYKKEDLGKFQFVFISEFFSC